MGDVYDRASRCKWLAQSRSVGLWLPGGVTVSLGVGFRICKMGVRGPRGEPQLIRDGEGPGKSASPAARRFRLRSPVLLS